MRILGVEAMGEDAECVFFVHWRAGSVTCYRVGADSVEQSVVSMVCFCDVVE